MSSGDRRARRELPPAIGPADMLRALHALQPADRATRERIAGLLGFGWDEPLGADERLDRPVARLAGLGEPPHGGGPPEPAEPTHEFLELDQAEVPEMRAAPEGDEGAAPDWWVAALGSPLPVGTAGPPEPIPPLLAPSRSRAILTGALAVPEAIGPVEVDRVIETIARRQPVTELPREVVWTPRRGVQVLVDRGLACAPFRPDQEQVVAELEGLVSIERLEVVDFRVHPRLHVVKERRSGFRGRYRLPHRGVPVLVLSNFGMGPEPPATPPVDPFGWLRLAQVLAARGSRVVGLVPVRRNRWNALLARALHLVPWDRRTGVLDVLRGCR